MSVDDSSVVDAIGVEKGSGKVILTVSDHLDWGDDHLPVLEKKLNTYVAFIESGELLESYPDAVGRQPVIEVVCKFDPDDRGRDYFLKAESVLGPAGIELRYRVLRS